MNGQARYERKLPLAPVNMTSAYGNIHAALDMQSCVVQPDLSRSAVAHQEENQVDDNLDEDQKKKQLIAKVLELQ